MQPDAVLKVGGSLSRADGLRDLCRQIEVLGERYCLMVVPGGGKFADLVREFYHKYKLDESTAHRMALLAMDQFGYLLKRLIGNGSLATEPESALQSACKGHVPILIPSASVLRDSRLPHSWQVTSDTVAAWVALVTGCPKLVLLKDVDGLMPVESSGEFGSECIRQMTVAQLKQRAGGVDAYLPQLLASARLESWVVNGLEHERLGELLASGYTVGTRILPDLS
ncbi:MAG: hypothetical protein P8Z37_06635 [Acidobacteriota bacterium]|jgi:aspartokinase-like uncharacterized kinase